MHLFLLLSLLACMPQPPAHAVTPVAIGERLPVAELPLELPDPRGRTVILEMVRSVDW